MLSIGKLVDPDYYLDKVADGVEAYYSLRGESAGRWLGRGATRLGLDGQVEGAQLKAILDGSDAATGESLGAGANRKNMGFDLCFRAPKSVSVLAGLGDPDTVAAIHACHDRAVVAALEYLERTATWTRRGHNGVEVIRGDGLVGAAFRHRTSRAQDPHLHTHVLVANVTLGADGRWSTLDGRFVYAQAKTAGYLYEAQLRAELTATLGVEWGPVHNGIADVRGIPGGVLRTFSKRRAEVEARLGELGFSSPRAAEVATLDTRRRKTHALEGGVLRARWRDEAVAQGFGPTEYAATLGRATAVEIAAELEEQIGSALSSSAGLTRQVSTFDRRDILQAICDRLITGAPIATLEAVASRYVSRPEVIDLGGGSRSVLRRDDGKVVPVHPGGPTYSTAELLAVEERLVASAVSRRRSGCGMATAEALTAALAARPALSGEQARLVVALATTGNGLDVVAAAAGTGKTFSLDSARDAWQRSGFRVIGCALAARAAAELEAGAGIASMTVARLLTDLDGPGGGLGPRTIVVCDEAAMVGSRDLERVAAHVEAAGAKLVLCGDARQLPSVDAGGGFAALGKRLGTLTLTENRRQREAWERDALARLRSGHVDDAVERYDQHGRVFRGPTAEDVREAIVAHWWAATTAGDSVLMLAARRADVDDLNARARARMVLAGKLAGPELIVDDRPFQAGDRIMTLRNDYRLEVRNGTVATVVAVDTAARTMTIRTDTNLTVTLPSAYLDAGKVTHAYASTVHKAQGQTAEHALLLGNDDLFLELGYVGLSRGRATNHLYMVQTPDTSEDERGARHGVEDPYQHLLRSLGQSQAKHLAIDVRAAQPRTLIELFAERERLLAVLAAGGPDPAADLHALGARRDELVGHLRRQTERLAEAEARLSRGKRRRRHDWPDPEHAQASVNVSNLRRNVADVDTEIDAARARGAQRIRFLEIHSDDRTQLDRCEQAIEAALAARLGQIGRNPPAYLTAVLGPIPQSRTNGTAWWAAARQVETYRAQNGISDPTTALGPAPRQTSRVCEWVDVNDHLRSIGDRLGGNQLAAHEQLRGQRHAALEIGL